MTESIKASTCSTRPIRLDGIVTAAEMMRQARQHDAPLPESDTTTAAITTSKTRSINDIDDEIQRLERELQQDDDDNDTSTGSIRSDGHDDDDIKPEAVMILSISTSNQNPIEKLPTHCLPPPLVSTGTKSRSTKSKKRSRNDDMNESNKNISGAGLKKAVQELIQNYHGRATTERIPFYCRYCLHQATDYKDLVHHQTLPSHLQNVTIHNKASYCKLCSKQFNSPIQLLEHLQSKPHHDRLQYLQSKQPQKPRPQRHHSSDKK